MVAYAFCPSSQSRSWLYCNRTLELGLLEHYIVHLFLAGDHWVARFLFVGQAAFFLTSHTRLEARSFSPVRGIDRETIVKNNPYDDVFPCLTPSNSSLFSPSDIRLLLLDSFVGCPYFTCHVGIGGGLALPVVVNNLLIII